MNSGSKKPSILFSKTYAFTSVISMFAFLFTVFLAAAQIIPGFVVSIVFPICVLATVVALIMAVHKKYTSQ